MELEKQVVSLELVKKLKELGLPQKSYFGWCKGKRTRWSVWNDCECSEFQTERYTGTEAAFTVAELGEMLPNERKERLIYNRVGVRKVFTWDETSISGGNESDIWLLTRYHLRQIF